MPKSERRLRPMGIGDLLDEMFDVYRSNFITLVGIMAVVQVPVTMVGLIITELPRKPIPGAGLFYILIALAAGFLTLAAATWAVSEV
ncbi:MAG: hypothetical protein Q7N50_06895, partial [Armatimonadota bacterium]|nr:hypothetical protein [Armatimonadota bacterium]